MRTRALSSRSVRSMTTAGTPSSATPPGSSARASRSSSAARSAPPPLPSHHPSRPVAPSKFPSQGPPLHAPHRIPRRAARTSPPTTSARSTSSTRSTSSSPSPPSSAGSASRTSTRPAAPPRSLFSLILRATYPLSAAPPSALRAARGLCPPGPQPSPPAAHARRSSSPNTHFLRPPHPRWSSRSSSSSTSSPSSSSSTTPSASSAPAWRAPPFNILHRHLPATTSALSPPLLAAFACRGTQTHTPHSPPIPQSPRQAFSPQSLIDLLTAVPLALQGQPAFSTWVSFSFLRALSALYAYEALESSGALENVSDIRRRIVVVLFRFMTIIVCFAGIMYILEAGSPPRTHAYPAPSTRGKVVSELRCARARPPARPRPRTDPGGHPPLRRQVRHHRDGRSVLLPGALCPPPPPPPPSPPLLPPAAAPRSHLS